MMPQRTPRQSKPGQGKKVLVAMSGGVDSSVAAALLKRDGYHVVGVFMRLGGATDDPPVNLFDPDNPLACAGFEAGGGEGQAHHQGCCSLNDAADARLVAALLDVSFYVLNFRKDFERVIAYFVDEYNAGRTPNPCVRCNDWLKFGKLADYARQIDADFIATGHYARVQHDDAGGDSQLLRGLDHAKDQSYVLFGTPKRQLQHMLLPIGSLRKEQVRALAADLNLPVFDKPDSQEICFVPDQDYAGLVKQRTPAAFTPGPILDREGNHVGEHEGHQHFTIGQRRGVGVALGRPLYVIDKNPAANTVTVGDKHDLMALGLAARDTNWLIDPPRDTPLPCTVKIRYNAQPVPAHVLATAADTLEVQFDQPQSAVAPGQAVACYRDDQLLGGGWIERALR